MAESVDVAWDKVTWVMRKRHLLDDCLSDYIRSEPYRIVADPDGKKKLYITKEPPVRLSIILGEMVYQLRSALDYLFFDLVERNHAKCSLSSRWKHDSQFPIIAKLPDKICTPPVPRDRFNCGVRDALTDEAFTFIEGVQPYYSGGQAGRLLRLLTKLSNIDKHRHLNATVLMPTRTQEVTTAEGHSSTAISPWIQSGAEIEPIMFHPFEVTGEMQVTDEITPEVAFDEAEIGPPPTAPIKDIVYTFPGFMLEVMIPNFTKLIENP